MREHRSLMMAAAIPMVVVGLVACAESPAAAGPETQLAMVAPAGGAMGVDTATDVTVGFNHAMMAGMEQYMVVHRGDVDGPLVPGSWHWSSDHMRATWMPSMPLSPNTMYTLHVGGGMMDADGHGVGFGEHGAAMGGHMMTGEMMGGGMMGSAGSMMGAGWRNAEGMYGMMFSFTTG